MTKLTRKHTTEHNTGIRLSILYKTAPIDGPIRKLDVAAAEICPISLARLLGHETVYLVITTFTIVNVCFVPPTMILLRNSNVLSVVTPINP